MTFPAHSMAHNQDIPELRLMTNLRGTVDTSTQPDLQQPSNQVQLLTQVMLATQGHNHTLSPHQVLTPLVTYDALTPWPLAAPGTRRRNDTVQVQPWISYSKHPVMCEIGF